MRAVLARLGIAIDVLASGSLGWLCLMSLELGAGHPDPARVLVRALYLTSLACQYSALFVVPLLLLHGLRLWLLQRGLSADRWLTLLLLIGLSVPAYRQAELLSSGGLLLDSEHAWLARIGIWCVLVGANLVLWHVQLLLIRAPSYTPWPAIALPTRYVKTWPASFATALWLVPGILALAAFGETVDRGLRAYVFLCQFLLPSAWFFATTLVFALQVRWRWSKRKLRAVGATVLLIAVCAAQFAAREVRSAKAEYERRGGTVALTDLAISSERGAPYANLDISKPARFHCPPPQAASSAASLPTPPDKRRNVILISIDTLRKDALSMQLDDKPAMPALRAWSEHSVAFERAVTTYPATLFALASAFTGQSPSEVLFAPKPPANLFTLTKQQFREQWIALPSTGWFRRHPVPELLTQSVAPMYWPDAEKSTTWMISRLKLARSFGHRTLAWIHYFEPHTSKVTGRGRAAEESAKRSYAGLIQQVDQQLNRLLQALQSLGYLEDSLLIVFSDHGEALGEFDYFGHHVYLNQFATDVPLFVRAPGLLPQRSQRLVLLSDIAPTVLEWLGQPAAISGARSLFSTDPNQRYGLSEAFPIRGRALYDLARVPITDPAKLAERMQLIRTAAIDYQPKVSLLSARYRLIVNRETGTEEFYDRVADPNEDHDLSQDSLAVYDDMRTALGSLQRELSERIYCRVTSQH